MDIVQEIESIKTKINFLEAAFSAMGFTGEWVPIAQAAPMLGIKPRTILTCIHRAETARSSQQPHGLKHGVHYRNVGDSTASKPTWQVHFSKFQDWLNEPPEQRD